MAFFATVPLKRSWHAGVSWSDWVRELVSDKTMNTGMRAAMRDEAHGTGRKRELLFARLPSNVFASANRRASFQQLGEHEPATLLTLQTAWGR